MIPYQRALVVISILVTAPFLIPGAGAYTCSNSKTVTGHDYISGGAAGSFGFEVTDSPTFSYNCDDGSPHVTAGTWTCSYDSSRYTRNYCNLDTGASWRDISASFTCISSLCDYGQTTTLGVNVFVHNDGTFSCTFPSGGWWPTGADGGSSCG